MKLSLITGGASGLGLALAQALAKEGVELILIGRDGEKLKKAAAELPKTTQTFSLDLSSVVEREQLIALIREKKPDLVINNAGFGLYGPALNHPTADSEEILEVNVHALMQITLEAARMMKEEKMRGTICNISSAAAFFSYPTLCVYAASKAFVNAFSEGLDQELKKEGIRVLASCPGKIDTDFRKRASKNFPSEKSSHTMPVKTAARLILGQIKKGKPLQIINWRYRFLVALSRFLPKKWIYKILDNSLKGRY
jgi:uncharacterized protein